VAAAPAPAAVQVVTHPEPKLNILLAEDNLVNQRVAMRFLKGRATALRSRSMAGGDREVEHTQLRPDSDGRPDARNRRFQAAAAIREREQQSGAHIPIIAMTAYA